MLDVTKRTKFIALFIAERAEGQKEMTCYASQTEEINNKKLGKSKNNLA